MNSLAVDSLPEDRVECAAREARKGYIVHRAK